MAHALDTKSNSVKKFSKDEYGKPVVGSLTEMRGQKANIHISRELLQLCEIIDSEGEPYSDNPNLKAICFGDLFHLYTHISNKVVGILLRARKYHLLDFEGEMLFQRRDDEVPIYMLKSIADIKNEIKEKEESVRSNMSDNPKPTMALLNK